MKKIFEDSVRAEILTQLKRVTYANSPAIYEKIQTKNGYTYIEKMVLERVISTQLAIDEVIPQIEQELNDL